MPLLSVLLAFVLSARAAAVAPQVAGSFYPAGTDELRGAVDGYLSAASSAASLGEILGLLAPHAGYPYSGRTAADAYKALLGRSYDTVFILATGHRTSVAGAATLAEGGFTTPLGVVEVDSRAVAGLMKLSSLITPFPVAFIGEHSVEVQLPFLQRTLLPGFKVVPLLMNTQDAGVMRRVGSAVAQLCKPGRTLLLVSSDLSHYSDKATAGVVDAATLAALTGRPDDPDYFWSTNRALMRRAGNGLVCTYGSRTPGSRPLSL